MGSGTGTFSSATGGGSWTWAGTVPTSAFPANWHAGTGGVWLSGALTGTFAFSLPSGQAVTGVQVSFSRSNADAPGSPIQTYSISLAVGDQSGGAAPDGSLWDASTVVETYGDSANLLGLPTSLTTDELNASNLDWSLTANSNSSDAYTYGAYVYTMTATVWYGSSGDSAVALPSSVIVPRPQRKVLIPRPLLYRSALRSASHGPMPAPLVVSLPRKYWLPDW